MTFVLPCCHQASNQSSFLLLHPLYSLFILFTVVFPFGSPSLFLDAESPAMTFHFDLGDETFSSDSFDLDLAIHASVVFATPPGTWNPWRNSESFKKGLIAGNIWVDKGPSFQLHLYISFDGESGLRSSHPTFVSRVGNLLGKSKVWSELGLEVSFEGSNEILLEHQHHLSFSFRQSTRKATASSPKTSRIPTALQSPCDAPSVDTVPTVFLSKITVRLEYTTRPPLIPSYSTSEMALNPMPYTTIYGSPKAPIVLQTPIALFQLEPTQLPTTKLQYIEEEWEAFHCLIPEPDLHPGPSSRELNSLLNTALATLIAGKLTRKGHQREQEPQKQTLLPLSQVAPSIFSPGYRDSMNQRAQLIPSIAKSISSIIKHSRDPSLQSNAIRFQRSSESETKAEVGDTATMSLKSRLKTSLWRVAANQVHTVQGSRKNTPLVLVPEEKTGCENGPSFEDEILFTETPPDDIISSQENENSEDGGFDRYLGTEEEGSLFDEAEVGSFMTMDGEHSDHSMDLFGYHDPEKGLFERSDRSKFIPGNSQLSWEPPSDDLEYPESPLLLSDGPSFENKLHEEACDDMLCE